MSRKRRRKSRKKKSRIDYRKVVLFIFICLVLIFATAAILSKFISHKNEYFDEALSYYTEQEYDKALELFNAALEENQLFSQNKDKNTKLYIADIYMKTGEYEKAISEYDEILKYASVDTDDVTKMQDIASALSDFSEGNYAGALTVLEENAEDFPELYMYVGTCYSALSDAENMFANYDKYIELYGWNSYLYAQYAAYYISIGELDNAYGYINNGLSSDDTFNKELRLQEIVYYEKTYNYEKAYELAEELYELYPDFEKGVDEYTFLYTRVSKD